MEDTNMTKKEYQKPSMEIIEADMELQLLVGSLADVTTSGLGLEDLELDEDGEIPDLGW